MTNDYKKIPQLPSGIDEQGNLLAGGSSAGKNWVIVDGQEYRKRPGLRPVLKQLATDDVAASTAFVSLLAPRGVTAAAEYVVGNQPREYSFEKLTPIAGAGMLDTLYIYNDTQLVTIQDGRPVVIRKIPVLQINGLNSSYRYGVNATTGVLEFTIRNWSTMVEIAYPVTSTSTLADLANYVTGVAECYLVDSLYENANLFSCMPGLAGLPASCLVQTSGSTWLNLDQYKNYIYAYVPFEMPLSVPTSDGKVYRAFYTQEVAGRDSNVMGVQFQEEMLFAGRKDALMAFDGYRMSVAGCNTPSGCLSSTTVGTGSLSIGIYYYILRCKTTKPSGQVTYGPPVTRTQSVNPNDSVVLSLVFDEINNAGAVYSDVAYAPRKKNAFLQTGTVSHQISSTTATLFKPQIGEVYVGEHGSDAAADAYITAVTAVGGTDFTITKSGGLYPYAKPASLGTEVEVYRTTVNAGTGGTHYYIGTFALGAADITDGLSDANLVNYALYVAKPYVIQRPPDCCIAVANHQQRIVVLGEYGKGFTLTDTKPFIRNVYWSQPNNEEFNPLNNAVLDVTEGGELNSVVSTGDALYVGGAESMWVFQGTLASTASSFTVNRIAGAGGTVGNTAVCALNGRVFAVSRAGLYTLAGGSADYTVGMPVNSIIRRISKDLLPFTRLVALKGNTGLALILPGMVFERTAVQAEASDEIFPTAFVATELASDTVTLVYDPNTDKWSTWEGSEMYMGGGLVEFDGLTWAFPRKDGKPICVLDSNYGKDGYDTSVEMVIKGPWQSDEDLFTDKNFARLRIICAAPGRQNFALTTKIERNWNENQAWQTGSVSFRDGDGYGQLPYGQYPYGDPNELAQQLPLTNQKALSVRAVFENSDPAEFPSITGWNFEVGENRKNMKQE